MGETTMRLRAVTERKLTGWNSSGGSLRTAILRAFSAMGGRK